LNYRKVRESCERIAHVLGINTNPLTQSNNEMPSYPHTTVSAMNHVKTPTDYFSPQRKGDQTTMASNFFNPR